MPVATPEQYAEMLDKAKNKGFAYPAVNVSSSQTINAVLQGLTEAGSDGIIQVTTGGADYFAGQTVKNRASGAIAFARFATEVAKNYPITVALHTDHCPKPALESFVLPLIAASEEEVKAVVAEGAEDLPTVARLHALRCDRVQGYALSRPVPLGVLLGQQDRTVVAPVL